MFLPKVESLYYPYFVTTPPIGSPLLLNDVKDQLRIPYTETYQDNYLQNLINSVWKYCENYTRRILLTTTFQTFRDFLLDQIELRKSPFQSITDFSVYNEGIWTVVDPTLYVIYRQNDYARIIFPKGLSGVLYDRQTPQSIRISFKVGYGDDASSIPPDLLIAMLQCVAVFYELRGDCCDEGSVPKRALSIYDMYRIKEFHQQTMI